MVAPLRLIYNTTNRVRVISNMLRNHPVAYGRITAAKRVQGVKEPGEREGHSCGG